MRSFFSILLVFTSTLASAQLYSILGTVLEGETNKPLRNTTVFIDNTTHSARTKPDGSFMITGLQAIHYNLVIYRAGYEPQMVDVLPGEPLAYKIILKPAQKRIAPLVLPGQEKTRIEKYNELTLFTDHFIGLGSNHRQCTIVNPNALVFKRKADTLQVDVDTSLWVDNRGLGYRMKFLVDNFEYDTTAKLTDLSVNVLYEPLIAKDDKETKRWAENRLKAYRGSVMHFLRAFFNKNLNAEGFYFNLFTDINPGEFGGGFERTSQSDSVKSVPSPIYNNRAINIATITDYNLVIDSLSFPGEPTLDFAGDLEVTYIMEEEGYAYQQSKRERPQRKPQRSELTLHRPAVIQPHGQVYPPDAIDVRGYWGWELMSERLPLNYNPKSDLKIVGND